MAQLRKTVAGYETSPQSQHQPITSCFNCPAKEVSLTILRTPLGYP